MLPAAPPEGVSAFVPAPRAGRAHVPPPGQILLALPATAASSSVLRTLRSDGLSAAPTHDGIGVLDAVRADGPALIVLDVELPGPDHSALIASLQAEAPSTPMIAVTPRERRAGLLAMLRADRDDYVLRPFAVDELAARIRLRLRHGVPPEQNVVRLGDLSVDADAGEVLVDGRPVSLAPTEYSLLVALVADAGEIVSNAKLAERVWAEAASANLVQVYISYLRRKIGAERIRTVRGQGYVLEA